MYHYCSNNSFISIISNRSLRLSSLSLSNDSSEGKLVNSILEEMATADKQYEYLRNLFSIVDEIMDAYGFCMSHNSDLLSQWRAYADNASGMCIGFDKKLLQNKISLLNKSQTNTTFQLIKAEYNRSSQKKLLKEINDKWLEAINNNRSERFAKSLFQPKGKGLDGNIKKELNLKLAAQGYSMATQVFHRAYKIKHEGFDEELEWRILSFNLTTDSKPTFLPYENKIVPYKTFKIRPSHINKVLIGSNNKTPIKVIQKFLTDEGFDHVKVSRSKIPYC